MTQLKLTTFNIRCFGFNGDYHGKHKVEFRISYLKEFIEKNHADSEIFVLQEIMDPTILPQILPEGFKFYSYTHDYERHMYIVLCCKEDFEFKEVQTIPDTALDDTTSRPALYGKLVKENQELAHIVGVHLKSGFEHTENRIKQTKKIISFLNTLDTNLPIVMTGDFNSHVKEKTRKDQDDIEYINEVLKDKNLIRADQNDFTFVTSYEEAHLDHFWTNAQVKEVSVYDYKGLKTKELRNYYDQISDHLPVKITLNI